MAIGRTNAGGSNPLNFKIVAQEETPASTSRNLILYPFYQTTLTNNGVTFTDNGDGTVTANGTATAAAAFYCGSPSLEEWGVDLTEGEEYTVSGCPAGGGADTYNIQIVSHGWLWGYGSDYGAGKTITAQEVSGACNLKVVLRIVINAGVTVSNLVFKPQLEKGSTATDFVKYAQKENLIWIKSSTSVPGYTISGISTPSGAKTAGWVSIEATTGTASGAPEFNAIRKNELLIKPKSAKQYVNDVWTDVNAYIYGTAGWAQFPG